MKHVLGLNHGHDASACLVSDGAVVCAIQEERLRRKKRAWGPAREAARYCLETAGLDWGDLDLVVQSDATRRLDRYEPPYVLRRADPRLGAELVLPAPRPVLERLASAGRFVTISHHLAHAYSALALAPFEPDAVLVVDGSGSRRCELQEEERKAAGEGSPEATEKESCYVVSGGRLAPLAKRLGLATVRVGWEALESPWPLDGIGDVYGLVSRYLFGDELEGGKVMGLAAYGRPGGFPGTMIERGAEGALRFPTAWVEQLPPRERWTHRDQEGRDLARRTQEDFEEAVLHLVRWLSRQTGARSLCFVGGVALNTPANSRILGECPIERLFVPPATSDAGTALGSACFGHLVLLSGSRRAPVLTDFLGRTYPEAEIDRALERCPGLEVSRPRDVAERAAQALASGGVVAWFEGNSEFGPRALGHRSILADPRNPRTRDNLNDRVKRRESFRPFAPAVLEESLSLYFHPPRGEGVALLRTMLLSCRVREEKKSEIPAVVHVDGTSRVQAVPAGGAGLRAVLEAFHRRTGVPVLLNTSFNLKGEPIVETPSDALAAFLESPIDLLVLGGAVVEKRARAAGA